MEVETSGVVRMMGVVLTEDSAVRELAAAVSLDGTRPEEAAGAASVAVGVGVGAPPPLLLLVAAAEVGGGASDVGSSELGAGAGAADDAGGAALDAGRVGGAADEGGGAAEDVGGAAEEAGVLPPVPEACRFSLWCRYSLMPSMLRPSRVKAEVMATRAKRATKSQAWRNMAVAENGNESVWICWRRRVDRVQVCTAADAFHER